MKRFLLTLCALAMAVPVVAQQVIPTGVTTTRIKFVMVDDAGDPVEGATITGVSRVRGTGSYTAMTTPTTGHLGDGLHYLVADEDTTITGGLAREDMTFVIEASDAKTAFVQAVIEAEQATVEGIGDEIEGRELTLAADQSGVTQLGGITVSGTYMPSNVLQWNSSNVATPATAGYPAVTIKDGTGTGEIDTSGGAIVDARATGAGAEFTPTGGRLYFVDGTTDGTGDTGTRAAPFDTISSAISAAAPGDTIFIYDGTYSGALSWSKEGLTLIGESTAGVIISHSSGATITVPDNTTLVRLTVNTSDTSLGAGINLEDENFVTLQEVICNGKFDGIQAGNSFAFHATRCRFFGTYDGANLNAARNFLCDQCWFQTDCTYATSTDFHGAVCGSSSSDPITSATDGEFRNCTFFAQEEGNTSFRTSAVGGSGRIVFNGCTLVAWATHASGTGAVRALYERDSSNNSQFTLRDCTVDVYQEGSGSCRYFEIQGAASKLLYSSLAKTSIDTVAADLGAVTNIAPSASDNNDAITITAAKVQTGAIDADAVADDAIDAGAIASSAIGAAEVADGAIDAATLATDTITASKIAADSIGASELATDAITAAKIAADAIGASEIASSAITSGTEAVGFGTAQTGDSYTRLGAPAGASIAADIAGIESGGGGLDAAGMRAALGMASANLDTQLDALPTASENATQLLASSTTGSPSNNTVHQVLQWMKATMSASGVFTDAALEEAPSGGSASIPVNQVAVPAARTWKLQETSSGLVGESSRRMIVGETKVFSIDFAADLPTNGRLTDFDTITIESGTSGGVTFDTGGADTFGVDKNLAKLEITAVTAGTYVLEATVSYDSSDGGGTAKARVTLVVAE